MPGDEIYRVLVLEARGPDDLAAASQIAGELRADHRDIAAEIRDLAVIMESAWQGDAAGAARRGALPLAIEHELTEPLLFTDQDLFSRQVGSFVGAQRKVVEVPPAPEKPAPLVFVFNPEKRATYEQQLAAHNAAAQNNVDAMASYESDSMYNAEYLPRSYGSFIPDTAGVTVDVERSDGVVPPIGRDPRGPRIPRGDVGGDSGGPGWQPPAPAPGGGPSSASGGGGDGGVPPQGTNLNEFVSTPPTPSPGPTVNVAVSGVPGGPGGGGPSFVGGFGAVPGGPGSGSGGRAGVPGGGSGGVAGRAGGDGHGAGGRAGLGPVAGGTGLAEAGRGAGGARGGGAGGGAPVGAGMGRPQGGADEEHQRKSYLEGGDPEDLFGTNEMTAPPVIGEE